MNNLLIRDTKTGREYNVPEQLTQFLIDVKAEYDTLCDIDEEPREVRTAEDVKTPRLCFEKDHNPYIIYNTDWDGCSDNFELDPTLFSLSSDISKERDKVYVLLEDSDITSFSRPQPIGKAVLTEKEAMDWVAKKNYGDRSYEELQIDLTPTEVKNPN